MWADNNDFGISLLGCHLENQAASVVLLVPVHIPYCLRKLPLSWNGNKYRIQSHIASKCCVLLAHSSAGGAQIRVCSRRRSVLWSGSLWLEANDVQGSKRNCYVIIPYSQSAALQWSPSFYDSVYRNLHTKRRGRHSFMAVPLKKKDRYVRLLLMWCTTYFFILYF